MKIAVASGKGGTGKTLVSTSLAWLLASAGQRVTYVDTDVEEPNGHLFLHPKRTIRKRYAVPVPALRDSACSGCGECQRFCTYHAIMALPKGVLVMPELCHGCGGCLLACPDEALLEVEREIGSIESGEAATDRPIAFHSATLDVGEARATPLIAGLLETVPSADMVIVDVPAGTSCSAMEAIRHADRVLLVTEPTPFGLHDLELAVQMTRAIDRPMVALINRADLGDDQVRRYLQTEQIPIVAEIPFSRAMAAAYAQGRIVAEAIPELRERLLPVVRRLGSERSL